MQAYFSVMVMIFVAAAFFVSVKRHLRLREAGSFFRPDRSRLIRLAAGLVMVAGVLFVDEPARALIRSLTGLEGLLKFTNEFGQGKIVFPLLALAAYAGFVFGARRVERLAGLALVTSIFSGLLVQIVQTFFMRARPFLEGSGALDFFRFGDAAAAGRFFKADFRGFPSGHAGTAFGLFFGLAAAVRPLWLKILLVLPACLTAFSRVYLGKHWLSDTVASAVLAAWAAAFVRHLAREEKI